MNTEAEHGRGLRFTRVGRILAILLTFTAALLMAFNRYKLYIANPKVFVNVNVKANDSSSFIYFVIANVIVFVYSLASAVLSCIKKLKKSIVLPLLILDFMATILLFTGNAAATAIELVARKGIPHYGWEKFCDITKSFCGIATAANAISLLAAFIYSLMVVLSMMSIHRRISS